MQAMDSINEPSWHRLVWRHLSSADSAAEPEKEAEQLLWLADKLIASADAPVRAAGSHLYITVCR